MKIEAFCFSYIWHNFKILSVPACNVTTLSSRAISCIRMESAANVLETVMEARTLVSSHGCRKSSKYSISLRTFKFKIPFDNRQL